ncbi:MAG: ArnT family glycosyltransferase, partial [Microgenomates group bacterium]
MQKINFIKKNLIFFIFLTLYFFSISFRIITSPLPFYDWDEAIYMQVGREMIEKLSLVPIWQGKFWLDKPPLVMLTYGLWQKIFSFITPEISARLLNLLLNILFFILIYSLILKTTKSKLTAFFTVFITSFTPLSIQRAYTVNMDVFLGIGWFGYFLFYPNLTLSTLFLSLAVFSKSLLGFYPIFLNFGYYSFLFINKKIN